jgi:hypothetical protein
MGIIFSYDPANNIAQVVLRYADLPAEKLLALYELLNHINRHLLINHFFIDPVTRILVLHAGVNVTGYFLNKEAFKMVMTQNLGAGHTFMPLIVKLLATEQTPQSIIDGFYTAMDQIPEESVGPDGKLKGKKIPTDQPFIIHGSKDMPAFPTHSHGMTALVMPEFLVDHLAFGVEQNGGLIGASYKYFTKPENAGKLDSIKNGGTIKLMDKDLKENANPSTIVYCYRRVYPDFEMVKQAYNINEENNLSDADPAAWFVQIYVDGDDFALKDDYYKGGIKW